MANFRNQPRPAIARRRGYSPNRRGKRGTKLRLRLLKLALLPVVAMLGWWAWQHLPAREPGPWFPIRYVRVEGEIENLDVQKLQETLGPSINGGYFSLEMGEIEGAVRSFPWVDRVQLARVWPDTLEIRIAEQKAVARWGEKALLNPRGERFAPAGAESFTQLPVIYGPPGMESFLLGMLKSLNEKLAQQKASVVSLDMSKRRAWVVKLDNGLELHFGRQDPLKALDRFLGLVPKLGEDGFARLKSVDLRYPNGFAVIWKPSMDSGLEMPEKSGAGYQVKDKASDMAKEN